MSPSCCRRNAPSTGHTTMRLCSTGIYRYPWDPSQSWITTQSGSLTYNWWVTVVHLVSECGVCFSPGIQIISGVWSHYTGHLSVVVFIDWMLIFGHHRDKIFFFSPLETISTSLWASLYHHLPVLSVFSHVSCQFIFVHIFPVVVDPSPSNPSWTVC